MSYKLRGTAHWAKVLGAPKPAYNPGETEWAIDVEVNDAGVKYLNEIGLGSRLKDNKEYSPYIQFRRAGVKKNGPTAGQANKNIEVVDSKGVAWDQNLLIGNGSAVEVEFKTYIPEFRGKAFPAKANILKLTVLNHVPYVSPSDEADKRDREPKADTAEKWT
jgi:hypothetical protein